MDKSYKSFEAEVVKVDSMNECQRRYEAAVGFDRRPGSSHGSLLIIDCILDLDDKTSRIFTLPFCAGDVEVPPPRQVRAIGSLQHHVLSPPSYVRSPKRSL